MAANEGGYLKNSEIIETVSGAVDAPKDEPENDEGTFAESFGFYGQVCLALAILFVPLIFWPKAADVFGIAKLTLLWITVILALTLFVAWAAKTKAWPPMFRMAWGAIAFLAAATVATVFAGSPMLSFTGLSARFGGLISIILYVIFFMLVVAFYWRQPKGLAELVASAVSATGLLLIYVLIQRSGHDWLKWTRPVGGAFKYPIGTLGNSNFSGGFLGITLAFVLYLILATKRTLWKTALGVLFITQVAGLWFTQSRGGIIAAAVGLATTAFVLRDRLPRLIRLAIPVAAGLGAIVAVLVLFHPGTDRPIGPLSKLDVFRTATLESRTVWWKASIEIFKDDPITGSGLDHFQLTYPNHRPASAQFSKEIPDKPHNIFLENLASTGILGFGTYAFFVGMALFYGYKKSRRLEDPERLLATAFLSVLAAYLAQGIFSIDMVPLALLGWFALAGIATLADPRLAFARAKAKHAQIPEHNAPAKPAKMALLYTALFAGFLFLMWVGIHPFLADLKKVEARTVGNSDQSELAGQAYDQMLALNPLEASNFMLAAQWALERAGKSDDSQSKTLYYRLALNRYETARRLQPSNPNMVKRVAELYTAWAGDTDASQFPKANQWWETAVKNQPTDSSVHRSYGIALMSYADHKERDQALYRRALKQFLASARFNPTGADIWNKIGNAYRALSQIPKARSAYEKVLRMHPGDLEATERLKALAG